jgi:hypothetical protein
MDLDEEREESNRRGIENEKLSAMLTEKHEFLREAGELMQHAQQMYDNVRARSDTHSCVNYYLPTTISPFTL